MPFIAPEADLVDEDSLLPVASPTPTRPGGGFIAPAADVVNENGHTPMEAAKFYLDAAGDGLPTSLDRSLSWQDQAEQHYQAAKAHWNQNPLRRLEDSAADTLSELRQHPLATAGHAWDATSGAVSGLYHRAKQGTSEAWQETKRDFADHPLRAPIDLLATVTVGGLQGLYGLGKLGAEAAGKVSDAAANLSPANADDPDAAGRYRAYRDYLLRAYNQDVEAPAKAAIREASPLPAVQDAAEVVAPALVPMGEAGLVTKAADGLASAAPVVGGRFLQGVGKLGTMVADNAPLLTTGEALWAFHHSGMAQAAKEVTAGAIAARILRPLAPELEAYGQGLATGRPSEFVGRLGPPVLQTGLRGGTAASVDSDKYRLGPAPWIAPQSEVVPVTPPAATTGFHRAGERPRLGG